MAWKSDREIAEARGREEPGPDIPQLLRAGYLKRAKRQPCLLEFERDADGEVTSRIRPKEDGEARGEKAARPD